MAFANDNWFKAVDASTRAAEHDKRLAQSLLDQALSAQDADGIMKGRQAVEFAADAIRCFEEARTLGPSPKANKLIINGKGRLKDCWRLMSGENDQKSSEED